MLALKYACTAAFLAGLSSVRAQRTIENTGMPAGLFSDCPGAQKNVTISPKLLKELTMVIHQLDGDQVVRRRYTYANAARLIAQDRLLDLKNRPTALYVPGFMDSTVFAHNKAVATLYAKRGYNVIMVETVRFFTYVYPKAVRIAREVARRTADVIIQLHRLGLPAERLELVGFSLGAHVCHRVARLFYEETGKKVARATGLDPAGPCYRNLPPEDRFSPGYAERVDAIHTNIDGFGMAVPIGDVDFYVNGGEFQPSDIIEVPCLVICSHFRAILYWWIALEHPNKFLAVQCDSVQSARDSKCYSDNGTVNYMGLETDFSRKGLFYLGTTNLYPYYLGKEGLKSENEVVGYHMRAINSDDQLQVV